jgi:hypothetical protein
MLLTEKLRMQTAFLHKMWFVTLLLFAFLGNGLLAQNDSLKQSTQGFLEKKMLQAKDFLHDEKPSPKKAAILSLALPGLGQTYNGKDWKVPIVYAGLGTATYLIKRNKRSYERFKLAYEQRLAEEEDEFKGIISQPQSIKNLRDDARKKLEQSWFALVAVYLLNSVDAFVDAHFFDFNMSDDLSLHWSPKLELAPMPNGNNAASPSIGLVLGF